MATRHPMPETLDDLRDWLRLLDEHLAQLNKWANEVTKMLRRIDWDRLARDYPCKPGAQGDPQTNPPNWPPK